MSQQIERKMKEKYSTSTIKSLRRVIKMVATIYKKGRFDIGIIRDNNLYMLKEYLSKFKIATQDAYLGYLGMLYDLYNRPQPLTLKKYSSDVRKEVKNHHQSKKDEELNELDLDEVVKVLNEKRKSNPCLTNYQKWILVSIINEHPLRLNELSVVTYNDNTEDNYVNLTTKKIVIRNHKSKKTLGTKEYDLSKKLVNKIKLYKKLFRNEYLFVTNRYPYDNPASCHVMTAMWNSSIKTYYATIDDPHKPYKPYGIHDARHQYATKKCGEINIDTATLKKLQKIQKEMGHTHLSTTLTHYLKTIK